MGKDSARGTDGDGDFPGAQAGTESSGHVVSGPGRHRGVDGQGELLCGRPGERAGRVPRTEDHGKGRSPVLIAVDQREEVESVPVLTRRPVAGAGSITPVGDQLAGEAEGEPVVRKKNVRDPCTRFGFAATKPGEFGHGERRPRHASARIDPSFCTEQADQAIGILGGLGVVPQLGRAQHFLAAVQDDQTVLLRCHGNCTHVCRPGPALGSNEGLGRRLDQGCPPGTRRLLAAGRGRGRVGGSAGADHLPGEDISKLHLRRLCG